MKVLITGGTGFIGSHTHKALAKKGYKTYLFKGDVKKVGDWEKNLKRGIDTVFHLASVRTQTERDFEVNTKGAENFFKAVEKIGKKPGKFIFVSSQAVYMGCQPLFKEEMKVSPLTIYGKSKYQAEKIVFRCGQKLGIGIIILRYSTVLGSGVRAKSNMSGPLHFWTKAALKGDDIKVFQDGKQTRDYVHVDDVVRANILAIEKDIEGVFNVGGGKEITLLSLAKMVKNAAKSQSEIVVTGKYSKTDPRHMYSNCAKLKNLGWKSEKTAKQAVYEFVKEYKEQKERKGKK